jgi:hypothetical protein
MKRLFYIIKEVTLTTIACVGGWIATKLERANKVKLIKRSVGMFIVLNFVPLIVSIDNHNPKLGTTFSEKYFNVFKFQLCVVGVLALLVVGILLVIWLFGGFEDGDVDDSLPA